jgi:putative protease
VSDLCQQDVFLDKEGWALKSVGTAILGGRDVCLLEHLERIVAAGHRHFRIEALSERPQYRRDVGDVYRAALTRALAGDHRLEDNWWRILRGFAARGFANGYAFGKSGMDYVGRTAPEPLPALTCPGHRRPHRPGR